MTAESGNQQRRFVRMWYIMRKIFNMSWIDEELERRRKEDVVRESSLAKEVHRQDVVLDGVPWAWKHLVDALVLDVEKFNVVSNRKATTRVLPSKIDVFWRGKPGPLLTVELDSKKLAIVYTLPSESPKKIRVVLNDYSDPYLWVEEEGQVTFERASELLLKPALFPTINRSPG